MLQEKIARPSRSNSEFQMLRHVLQEFSHRVLLLTSFREGELSMALG